MTHEFPNPVYIFDSRHWNSILPPQGAKYQGYIAKATEGDNFTSPDFPKQYRAVQQLGLARAAWSFHRYASDPAAAARLYHQAINANGGYGELPPVFDAEDNRAPRSLSLVTHMWTQVQEMEQLAGREVLVYTAAWWWNSWAKPYTTASHPFYTRKLWEADPEPDTAEPGYWNKDDLVMIQTRLDFNPGGFNAVIDENVAKRDWFESLTQPTDSVTITIQKSTADDLRRALA